MTNKGYNKLILPDGTELCPAVVRFDADGNVLDYHLMQVEEPFVEWVGGTFDLR